MTVAGRKKYKVYKENDEGGCQIKTGSHFFHFYISNPWSVSDPAFRRIRGSFLYFPQKSIPENGWSKTGKHLVKEVKRDLQQVGFRSADRAGVMDVTGIHQKDIACVQQEGFLAADDMHGTGGDV